MSLALDLQRYLDELESTNAECMRPKPDGSPCPQCYERERVIRRLREILAWPPKQKDAK